MLYTSFELCVDFNFNLEAKKLYYYRLHNIYEMSKQGKLKIVKWLHNTPSHKRQLSFYIHPIVMSDFKEFEKRKCEHSVSIASENGHLSVVQYLIKHGYFINRDTIMQSIKNGHINVVKFLINVPNYSYNKLDMMIKYIINIGEIHLCVSIFRLNFVLNFHLF